MSTHKIDEQRRKFLTTATTVAGGVGVLAAALPFVTSLLPSAKAEAAAAPVEVDLSPLQPGQMLTVEWQGKPVWIIYRTKAMIEALHKHENELRDPESRVDQQPEYAHNEHRSINPDYLVLIGICTHLGCSPQYVPTAHELGPHWPGGFYCPCHGSSFDLAGRVFKGVPAPINLAVPPYTFLAEKRILIGTDWNPGQGIRDGQ